MSCSPRSRIGCARSETHGASWPSRREPRGEPPVILGVNGRFLGARATGVQRFAGEIVRRLWADTERGVLLLPRDVEAPADLPERVTVVRGRTSGHRWERG